MVDKRETHGACKGYERDMTYQTWQNMKQRCKRQYRDKEIKICQEWENYYPQFLKDMGERPSKEYSIERIDNEGGYTKENCKWATHTEQMANRSNTRMIEHNGQAKPLTQWAREKGITPACLRQRINLGWGVEKALNTTMLRNDKRVCDQQGCDTKHFAKGLCNKHYMRAKYLRIKNMDK